MKISYRTWWYMTFDFGFDWTRTSPYRFLILMLLFLFRLVLLPNLHISVPSLASGYCFNVTADRSSDFGAPTASLILDHLKVV